MTPSLYAEPDVLARLDFPTPPLHSNRLIGLHGFAQSGKDTVAGILKDYGYEQIILARPILEALVRLNPIVQSDNRGRLHRFNSILLEEGYEGAKQTTEFRRLMQVFGTEVGRDLFGENVWLDAAARKMEPGRLYVISDVRFHNEAQFIADRGGMLVKVVRPDTGPVNGHNSDAGLPDSLFDVILHNDGTLQDLANRVYMDLV
jgi:hypothetical protein